MLYFLEPPIIAQLPELNFEFLMLECWHDSAINIHFSIANHNCPLIKLKALGKEVKKQNGFQTWLLAMTTIET